MVRKRAIILATILLAILTNPAKTYNQKRHDTCTVQEFLVGDVSQLSFYEEDVFFLDFEWFIKCDEKSIVINSMEVKFEPADKGIPTVYPNLKAISITPEKHRESVDINLDFMSCISLEYLSSAENLMIFCSEQFQSLKKGAYILSVKNPLKSPHKVDFVNLGQDHLDFLHAGQNGFAHHYQNSLFEQGPIILSALHKTDSQKIDIIILDSSSLRTIARKTLEVEFQIQPGDSGVKVISLESGIIALDFSNSFGSFKIGLFSYNLDFNTWGELVFVDLDDPTMQSLKFQEFFKVEGKYGRLMILGKTDKNKLASAICSSAKSSDVSSPQASSSLNCRIIRQNQEDAPFGSKDRYFVDVSEFPQGRSSISTFPGITIVTLKSDILQVAYIEERDDFYLKTLYLLPAQSPYFGFDDPTSVKI